MNERNRLDAIRDDFVSGMVSDRDIEYAKTLSKRYRVKLDSSGIDKQWLDQMLHRVDVIPEALVLVQGANESLMGYLSLCNSG